jgi:hypothetical protein
LLMYFNRMKSATDGMNLLGFSTNTNKSFANWDASKAPANSTRSSRRHPADGPKRPHLSDSNRKSESGRKNKKNKTKTKNPTNIALFLLFFCKVIAHVLFNATHPPTQHFQSKVKAGKYQKNSVRNFWNWNQIIWRKESKQELE